jgi:hypothetical protein
MYNAILARVKEAERILEEPYVYVDASAIERAPARGAAKGKGAAPAPRRAKY